MSENTHAAPAVAAYPDLPVDADHDAVHPSPRDGHCALCRHSIVGLVAAGRGQRAGSLCGRAGSIGGWYGKLVLFGYSWALFHHMFGGLRHFIWDTGRGFELRTVEILARISTFVPPVLTMFVWVMAYYYMGAWS